MGEVHKLDRRGRRDAKSHKGPGGKAAPCPICGKPATPTARPFCSTHCANIDLGRWLGGDYRVPTNETPESEAEPSGRDDEV